MIQIVRNVNSHCQAIRRFDQVKLINIYQAAQKNVDHFIQLDLIVPPILNTGFTWTRLTPKISSNVFWIIWTLASTQIKSIRALQYYLIRNGIL